MINISQKIKYNTKNNFIYFTRNRLVKLKRTGPRELNLLGKR